MAPLELLHLILYVALAVLALVVARREPEHRPVAAFVTWMVVTDLIRRLLGYLRAGQPKPYTGWTRVWFHGDELFVLSWSFLSMALCMHLFVRLKPWPALGGWAVAFVACLDYPTVSKATLGALYQGVSLLSLLVCWACIFWGIARRRELEPSIAHLTAILYTVTDVAVNLVPFASDYFGNWPLVRVANLVLLASCLGVHGWWLVRRRAPAEAAA